jgi:NitT/TauT family transport system ATP-binding protein
VSRTEQIQVEALSYTYYTLRGETHVLRDLSLSVGPGEFCSIVGPSGCGKSTLLGLIAGLTPVQDGRVLVNGVPVRGPRHEVGFLLQRDHLFEWRTVLKNVEFGLEVQGRASAESRARAHQLLTDYGLAGFEQHYPDQLSGGMRQRVSLIRTLATDPEVVLLDEPFAALDYQTKLVLEREVYGIIRANRKTALLVTHDIEEAVSLSDRIVVLSGRPASVKQVYDIALTLPAAHTPLAARNAPEFRAYCNAIWDSLDIYLPDV